MAIPKTVPKPAFDSIDADGVAMLGLARGRVNQMVGIAIEGGKSSHSAGTNAERSPGSRARGAGAARCGRSRVRVTGAGQGGGSAGTQSQHFREVEDGTPGRKASMDREFQTA